MFTYSSRLFQAQVTGLISLGLIIIRLIAGSLSALLAWRIAFILLEKRGVTLVELARLTNFRTPILPGRGSGAPLVWSIWALATIILLWPHGFAAPLASSSVSWIPGTRVLQQSVPTSAAIVPSENAKWYLLQYPHARTSTILAAVAATAKDPAYAFHQSQLPLRRYFKPTQMVPDGSKIDMSVPYFAVDLRWVDASSDDRSQYVADSSHQDVNIGFGIRIAGAVNIIRDEPWEPQAAEPSKPDIFIGKKFIGVYLRWWEFSVSLLPDGSHPNKSTQCLTVSEEFGQLPNVDQYRQFQGVGDEITAYDCYMFAEATITAGSILAKECNVTASAGSAESYATCFIDRDDTAVKPHWLSELALDFTSEVLKYSVMQNYTQPWISNDLDDYVSGMLTLGYHAAWSALIPSFGNTTEPVEFRAASPIVLASIDNARLYIWLAMHATLTVSAVLVFLAQCVTKIKTIRDPTLAALTIDLTDVTHSGRTPGLCNAVALSKEDEKLPRLQWDRRTEKNRQGQAYHDDTSCRKIVFVDEVVRRRR
ncbi:MAG: hypothetical protein L6R40_002047 [Gallowayella cf. fulva]|nr:MAG: hypothetical protein L6R40_002047 [Xanthomendoza cf. fulva]